MMWLGSAKLESPSELLPANLNDSNGNGEKNLVFTLLEIFIVLLRSLLFNGMSSFFTCPANIRTTCTCGMTYCDVQK